MIDTRFISAFMSETSDLESIPIEASARNGLMKSGIRRLPTVSRSDA